MLTTIAVLIIVLGLMVSLARHVRAASADQLTKDILHGLDEAMAAYVKDNDDALPPVPPIIGQDPSPPNENAIAHAAAQNNAAFILYLQRKGYLNGRFGDLSIVYFDELRVRDAWGSPIVFMPAMHPAIGMSPKGWFFFSAGPDRQYLTRDDNLYSYEQPGAQP
ncbi:MAG: hypothetical protein M3O30_07265 [Planctomycetota bacterium]|nr:hypothetical protein [Planctomycetota bacterium]